MRIIYLVVLFLCCIFSLPANAGGHHHNHITGQIGLYGNGWNITLGSPNIPYYQPQLMFYGQYPPPPYIMSQPYYRSPQLITVCGPIYYVPTLYGLSAQQDCWQEWR